MRLAPEGRIIVLPLLGLTALSLYGTTSVGISMVIPWVFLGLLAFCINFFRDPYRPVPNDDNIVIAPADGKIVKIETIQDPELGESKLISIFLNVFNVHANRMPVKGTFSKVEYHEGKFLAAFDHKASDENERTEITFSTEFGTMKVKQIAGLIARRILCYAKPNDSMDMGDRLGYIRFGSRTDIILPNHVNLNVIMNQKVVGNQTIIGHFNEN